jgi:hypothetical protein
LNLKLRRHCGEHLDFRPLLSPDFLINTALRGGNPVTAAASDASFPAESFQAVATAPTVPNFPSASFAFCLSL